MVSTCAVTSPTSAAIAPPPALPPRKRSIKPRRATNRIAKRRFAPTTGSHIFKAWPKARMLRSVRSGGSPTNSPMAPAVCGTTSVITKIRYEQGSVAYSTFDKESTDVLRLNFVPKRVLAAGKPLERRSNVDAPGYWFDESTRVLRIRHDDGNEGLIQGAGGEAPPDYVTFDDPHLAAGTALEGEYPSGLLEWTAGQWKIGVPHGKFGTFNLALADAKTESAEFRFHTPMIFAGIAVYNGGKQEE